MSRSYSTVSSNTNKENKSSTSQVENVDQLADLEAVRSRHVAIANEPHPHADAQRDAAGLRPNEDIEIVEWDVEDPENPFNWSRRYKWVATLTTCFISILISIPAGAYGAASLQMSREWHIDETRLWAATLSFPWASSSLGFIGLLLSSVPLLLLLKGEAIRVRSPFMLDAAYDEEEKDERKSSIASRYTAERKASAVLPWSSDRAVE